MTPPSPQAVRTHECPGGCGRAVALHLYACTLCWVRLPAVLRRPIRENYRVDWEAHAAAVADGNDWFGQHPLHPDVDDEGQALIPAQPLPVDRPGQATLFDVPTRPVPTSVQLRLREQREALERGEHPLSVALGRPLPLHPDAAPAGDRRAPGLRCGSCVHRQLQRRGGYDWPKCLLPGAGRVTHGPGTDVRVWWPACVDHQPAEPAPAGRPP